MAAASTPVAIAHTVAVTTVVPVAVYAVTCFVQIAAVNVWVEI